MKILNLGCGGLLMENAINVDRNYPPDSDMPVGATYVESDIFEYLHSIDPCTVDEIHLYYVLEHFTLPQLLEVTWLINRALKINGKVFAVVPDFYVISQHYVNLTQEKALEFLLRSFYEVCGDPSDFHKTLWDEPLIKFLFETDGFTLEKLIRNVGGKALSIFFSCTKVANNSLSREEIKKLKNMEVQK
ncbi:MAG: class I SAM-dependent methyltransferase [Planctomycetota bacterium]|jgi:predicted SAM-dependent methyltransferase